MSVVPNKAQLMEDLRRARSLNTSFKAKVDIAMLKMEELEIKQPMDGEDKMFNVAVAMCLEILSEVK
jgi:hypothetical protein